MYNRAEANETVCHIQTNIKTDILFLLGNRVPVLLTQIYPPVSHSRDDFMRIRDFIRHIRVSSSTREPVSSASRTRGHIPAHCVYTFEIYFINLCKTSISFTRKIELRSINKL